MKDMKIRRVYIFGKTWIPEPQKKSKKQKRNDFSLVEDNPIL